MTRTRKAAKIKHVSKEFDGIWWCASLPNGWEAIREKQCATFTKDPGLGAVQVSAARRITGPVTDEDLIEFAGGRVPSGIELSELAFGAFSGFSAEYSKEGTHWKEWWLRSGSLILYITYNVKQGKEGLERDDVESLVASLKPTLS